ncbi:MULTISPECIES: hypothetical protein [Citrobacter]
MNGDSPAPNRPLVA